MSTRWPTFRPLLLAAAAALAAATPASAQAAFADVPLEHRAYRQMAWWGTFLFTGYPDGTFHGRRALTRYEFAVALQRMTYELEQIAPALLGARSDREIRHLHVTMRLWPAAAPAGTLTRQFQDFRGLLGEFRPELEMLGTPWEPLDRRFGELAEATKGLAVGLDPGNPAGKPFDRKRLDQLKEGDAGERARLGLSFLREEVESPSAPREEGGFVRVTTTHPDFLAETIERLAQSAPDAAVLGEALAAAPRGRLRDCLTITLGLLGEREMVEDLSRLVTDRDLPVPVRRCAVRALARVPDPKGTEALIRVLRRDPFWLRRREFQAGCIASGPLLRIYPMREEAAAALRAVRRKPGIDTARVDWALAAAVVWEPLERDPRTDLRP
jgi:hypothetical protein